MFRKNLVDVCFVEQKALQTNIGQGSCACILAHLLVSWLLLCICSALLSMYRAVLNHVLGSYMGRLV